MATKTAVRMPKSVTGFLSKEPVGGALLLAATVLALIFANTALGEGYFALRNTYVGWDVSETFSLRLSVGHWAADGLLAVFFFMIGLELKKEIVLGELRHPGKAMVPVAAALGGVALPAIFYLLVNVGGSSEALAGWAIPAATDIAFAVAVLAVVGSYLPAAIRTFLLTLAVVDDLIVIFIIAVFYTSELNLGYLALALVPMALFGFLARRFEMLFHRNALASWVVLTPIGFLVWALFLNSGIHATIAGVVLGFLIPIRMNRRTHAAGAAHGLAETVEHRVRPFSAGLCVPLFAFLSAGVAVGGWSGFTAALSEPTSLGVVLGLVVGKPLGIVGMTWLVTRLPGADLDDGIGWADVLGVGVLAGIGFTVSLLIAELSFDETGPYTDYAKIAILTGSTLASIVGATILAARNRRYRRLASPVG